MPYVPVAQPKDYVGKELDVPNGSPSTRSESTCSPKPLATISSSTSTRSRPRNAPFGKVLSPTGSCRCR